MGVDCVLPKKSRPSNESAGFVCLGAAFAAGGGGGRATVGGSVVLGRAGGLIVLSSSKKLTDCCAGRRRGGWLTGALCDAERSSFAFSWTTARGCSLITDRKHFEGVIIGQRTTSSSLPRVAGSGMGPSIAHRLDSYFVRMKFSIFLASQKTL